MPNQSDIASALQQAGVSVYGLQVQGPMVSGTVGSGEERVKAVQTIQRTAPDAQVNIQVNAGFADMGSGGGRQYTVKAGDTLSKIAKEVYGDASQWKKIHEANRASVPNPDMIHPGQELRIP